ncbi:MAG TPA: histidine phosphatase family protein [Candidatus Saccharimonadales bacterium]|nr:histidine phosphatase family protein [Candidatus Saccharimonadales bacterium]
MKSIELRRHAEKDAKGTLTDDGIRASKKLGSNLPPFSKVVASDSSRARLTAKLITDIEPRVDPRASMWMTSPESSAEINNIATQQNLAFLEAMQVHNDPYTLDGTTSRADELNELIDQLFTELIEDQRGLIISHDLSINAAMTRRGLPLTILGPLEGYIIYEDGTINNVSVE